MTLSAFLNLFVEVTFLLLTLVALRDLWRQRDLTRLSIAAMFGSLAITILAGRIQARTDAELLWLQKVSNLALITHPYLLLRLVTLFRPVPRAAQRVATVGLIICWGIILFVPPDTASPLLALLILYFAFGEGYAAAALLRGARESGGVSRWRLLLVAAGTVMLAIAILLLATRGITEFLSVLTGLLFSLFAVAAAVCYYLGFAPPRWLRRAWQLRELHRFLHEATGRRVDEDVQETLVRVSRAATRAVGGITTVALFGESSERSLTVTASDNPAIGLSTLSLDEQGAIATAWRSRAPALATTPDEFGLDESGAVAAVGDARSVLAVPINTEVHAPGILVVFLSRRPLFAYDDLALLALFAEQSATTLDRITLLEEQRELVRRLEIANRELESFAYSVSHDLRAPLRAIDGFSQALLEDCAEQIDATGLRYLERVRANTQQMGELIDALLTLSRLSRTEMRMEFVDLSELATQIARELKQQNAERPVEFIVEPGLVVKGDARLLQVVLENLLENAWKFTSKEKQARIEFGALQSGKEGVYFVRDNGAGFDMAYVDKLFGAFQRLHTMSDFSGTGIGLATVQRIIHRHHGRIWADAAPDQGATFYFTLTPNGENHETTSHSAG